MTNEQYSNMMIAFAKLEAKIEKLEQQMVVTRIDTQLKEKYYTTSALANKVEVNGKLDVSPKAMRPEDFINFWNEGRLKEGCIRDNSVPPKPFFNVEKEENVTLCIWETFLPEYRTGAMGLVCSCKKCTPHSM